MKLSPTMGLLIQATLASSNNVIINKHLEVLFGLACKKDKSPLHHASCQHATWVFLPMDACPMSSLMENIELHTQFHNIFESGGGATLCSGGSNEPPNFKKKKKFIYFMYNIYFFVSLIL